MMTEKQSVDKKLACVDCGGNVVVQHQQFMGYISVRHGFGSPPATLVGVSLREPIFEKVKYCGGCGSLGMAPVTS